MITKLLRTKFIRPSHPNVIFWFCFLLLNGLLFLPLYLLNQEHTHFIPPIFLADSPLRQLIIWRNNLDMLRFNIEILFMIALWMFLPWLQTPNRSRWFARIFFVVYLVTLSYYVYESIMLSLYQVDPVFYNQYRLAVDGLQVVARHLQVPVGVYAAMIVGLILGPIIIGGIIWLMLAKVSATQLSRATKIGWGALTLWAIIAVITQQTALAAPKMVMSSITYKLQQNINNSVAAYQHVQAYDDDIVQRTYNYDGYTMLQKPNIYLIFVESYGSVLYKRPDYLDSYLALTDELQQQFQQAGWHTATTLSESPTWGGGSWMSYTSAMFGLRVDTHPQYLALREAYQTHSYPDLGHFLKNQKYQYVRLSSLSVELDEAERQEYENFYEMDQAIQYSDLNYSGPHYGWGPSPPDQYVINFAHQTLIKNARQPTLLFFITQNSHFPWVPLPELVDDWQSFNQINQDPKVPSAAPAHEVKRQNYFKSINYELRFLTDYILNAGDDESIFILIGDHQPQQVSRRSDSFDTPVHIISKNAAFVNAFAAYGFVPGLVVQNQAATMRHEGLYSMLVRELLSQYGQGNKVPPPYLPDGVVIEETVNDASLSHR